MIIKLIVVKHFKLLFFVFSSGGGGGEEKKKHVRESNNVVRTFSDIFEFLIIKMFSATIDFHPTK